MLAVVPGAGQEAAGLVGGTGTCPGGGVTGGGVTGGGVIGGGAVGGGAGGPKGEVNSKEIPLVASKITHSMFPLMFL